MTYHIILYDEGQIGRDADLRRIALETEERIRGDGYTIQYADGDGFLTYVSFDTVMDMAVFKIKYMSYHLHFGYWHLPIYRYPDMVEMGARENWCLDVGAAHRAFDHFKRNWHMTGIIVPRHEADIILTPEIVELLVQYDGRLHLYRHPKIDSPDAKTSSDYKYEWKIAMTESNMVLFKLSV